MCEYVSPSTQCQTWAWLRMLWPIGLAQKPALASAHIKRLVRQAHSPRTENMADERTLICDLMVQDDAVRLLQEGASGQRRITRHALKQH